MAMYCHSALSRDRRRLIVNQFPGVIHWVPWRMSLGVGVEGTMDEGTVSPRCAAASAVKSEGPGRLAVALAEGWLWRGGWVACGAVRQVAPCALSPRTCHYAILYVALTDRPNDRVRSLDAPHLEQSVNVSGLYTMDCGKLRVPKVKTNNPNLNWLPTYIRYQ